MHCGISEDSNSSGWNSGESNSLRCDSGKVADNKGVLELAEGLTGMEGLSMLAGGRKNGSTVGSRVDSFGRDVAAIG